MCPRSSTPSVQQNKPNHSVADMGDNFDLTMTDPNGKTTTVRKPADKVEEGSLTTATGINMK
jgi:hypothetical protein